MVNPCFEHAPNDITPTFQLARQNKGFLIILSKTFDELVDYIPQLPTRSAILG